MISPSVQWARAQSSSGCIRFCLLSAAWRSWARVVSAAWAVAAGADGLDAPDLFLLEAGGHFVQLGFGFVCVDVLVYADDDPLAALDLLLQPEAGVGDLALRVVLLDRRDHPAELVDLREIGIGLGLEAVGQRLDEIGAAQRVDRVRHPRLVRDDLLRAQRDPHGPLGRQRKRLIKRIRVQRLGAAEHRRQSLGRRPDDVDQRLLRRQADPRGLGVETHQKRTLIPSPIGVAEFARPDPPRRPVLRDLLKEIDMRIEKERQPRREIIDSEAALDARLHIRKAVLERKRKLLARRRTRLTNVIARNRNRVPTRHPLSTKLDHVGHQPQRRTNRETPLLLSDVLLQNVGLDRPRQTLRAQPPDAPPRPHKTPTSPPPAR